MELINKAVIVAEIERRVSDLYPKNGQGMVATKILKEHYKDLKDFINNLEVREVDLDKEFNSLLDNLEGMPRMRHSDEQIEWGKDIAEHFLELGISISNEAQKGA